MARKMLQDRINNLSPYFRGIEVYNDAIMVRVVFPGNWGVTGSDDGRVKVVKSDVIPDETVFYADSKDADYDDIMDVIEVNVTRNTEISKKEELFGEKVRELAKIFDEKKYKDLLNIDFVFKRKPKKKKEMPVVGGSVEEKEGVEAL